MKLYRSDAHFPYRRYTMRHRAPLWRKVRRTMRNVAQMHDIWAWVFVIAMLLSFLILDATR